MSTTVEQQVEKSAVPSDTVPPAPSDIQPRRDDGDWLVIGWTAWDGKYGDWRKWTRNHPRPADVYIGDVAEIPAAVSIFRDRWKARVRFPMMFIRASLTDAFERANDAIYEAECIGPSAEMNGDVPFLGHEDQKELYNESWDTIIIGAKDDDERPSEAVASGTQFIRQTDIPPISTLQVWLMKYAQDHWSAAQERYRDTRDRYEAGGLVVPSTDELKDWIEQLKMTAAAEPVPEKAGDPAKPAKSMATRVSDVTLEQAIETVWRRARGKGIKLSQRKVRQQVRAAGGHGTDGDITKAWNAYVEDTEARSMDT